MSKRSSRLAFPLPPDLETTALAGVLRCALWDLRLGRQWRGGRQSGLSPLLAVALPCIGSCALSSSQHFC